MDEYFCPNCGATLNNQYGFEPSKGSWTCTACGMHLMDEDVYEADTLEGVAWYCDGCGSLLNRQSGFSDSYGSWQCTQCGYLNGTTEDDIINIGPQCPNCSSYLKKQSYYGGYEDDWTCQECGAKLHRDYSCDTYEVVQEDGGPVCPNCNASLKKQYSFSDWMDNHICSECGAKLHRSYSGDPFEVVVEDQGPECPCCSDKLNNQSCYSEYEDYWTCENCGAKLHRDYNCDPYEEVDDASEEGDYSYSPPSPSSQTTEKKTGTSSNSSPNREDNRPKTVPDGELRKKRIMAFIFKRKCIKLGYDPHDLLRKDYMFVLTSLHNNAFNNIKCIPVKDIYSGSHYEVGEVEQIVVNSSQYFACDDMIPYDTEIIITYHEKKEISVPFNSRFCRKKNYAEIGNQLQELGFTNIHERAIRDLATGWIVKDGSIEKIIIGNDKSFKKNAIYVYDIEIVIEYHTFKNKT